MSDIATKLTAIAENQQRVYDAGYTAGQSAGGDTEAAYEQGVADGRQAEYDAFWNAYQDNGNRKDYCGAFYGKGWNINNFKPMHPIKTEGTVSNMFRDISMPGVDLADVLRVTGFDTSKSSGFTYNFHSANCKGTPMVDASNANTFSNEFANSKVEIIRLKVSESTPYTNVFYNCKELVELYITGTIGKSGLDFQWSTRLSKDSIIRIINALSTNASGLSITLSRAAVESAFDSTTADEWTALIAPKIAPNGGWTITLV